MMERFSHLRRKEVINICDGRRLGFVGDLELKVPEGEVKALIVFGPCRFFGLFGRGEDFYVPWDCVQRFGDDIILIDKPFQRRVWWPKWTPASSRAFMDTMFWFAMFVHFSFEFSFLPPEASSPRPTLRHRPGVRPCAEC